MEKKIFDLDLDRCVGCYSCVVACMDQNDIDPEGGEYMWRDVVTLSETGKIQYASIACMHCDDAPCVMTCPTGAITRGEDTRLVEADNTKCIGCHSCVMSCPFGAPKFGEDGKMEKCNGCSIRVANGLIPACVRICPTKALKYDTVGNIEQTKRRRTLKSALEGRR